MPKTSVLMLILILLASSAIMFTPAKAQNENKTIVVPDDFPTIEDAVKNATRGDTIFVKSGFYQENPLKIEKSLSLIGEGSYSTQISFNPPFTDLTVNILERYRFYDDPIEVDADVFTLSGFTINSTGGAISIAGNRTRITNNVLASPLRLNGGSYSSILENQFSDVTFNCTYGKVSSNHFWGNLYGGGQFTVFSSNDCHWGPVSIEGHDCLITNNQIADSSGWFKVNGANNIISKNTIEHVGFGLSVAGTNSQAFLNQIAHCGIGLNPSIGSICYANSITNCGWGIDTGGDLVNPNGTLNTLFHNNFINNRYQTGTIGNYKTDYYDNGEEGNYWNDYRGTDANGDGVGDTPYIIDDNRSDRYPLMKPFNLSNVEDLIPPWAAAPTVQLTSPQNTTYQTPLTINYTVNKQVDTVTYSLDGASNRSVTENITLTDLPSGVHNITVYATDVFGNIGASETISFTVAEPFPTGSLVAAVAVSLVAFVLAVGLVGYFKKKTG